MLELVQFGLLRRLQGGYLLRHLNWRGVCLGIWSFAHRLAIAAVRHGIVVGGRRVELRVQLIDAGRLLHQDLVRYMFHLLPRISVFGPDCTSFLGT